MVGEEQKWPETKAIFYGPTLFMGSLRNVGFQTRAVSSSREYIELDIGYVPLPCRHRRLSICTHACTIEVSWMLAQQDIDRRPDPVISSVNLSYILISNNNYIDPIAAQTSWTPLRNSHQYSTTSMRATTNRNIRHQDFVSFSWHSARQIPSWTLAIAQSHHTCNIIGKWNGNHHQLYKC